MTEGNPTLEIDGRIATITLRRPDVGNRLEAQDLEVLIDHLAAVEASQAMVLLFRSTGRFFCTGFNINSIGTQKTVGFSEVAHALEHCRAITIAVLQGSLYGGATDLALACDFRLGVSGIDMFVPASRLGVHFYPDGLRRYLQRLGLQTAMRVLVSAEKLDAAQMLDVGFLTELLEPDALEPRATAFATMLSGMAPLAMLPMKKHLNAMARGTFDPAGCAQDIDVAAASADNREGVLAWQEKRPPRFTGL